VKGVSTVNSRNTLHECHSQGFWKLQFKNYI